jgi:hypothetical protein
MQVRTLGLSAQHCQEAGLTPEHRRLLLQWAARDWIRWYGEEPEPEPKPKPEPEPEPDPEPEPERGGDGVGSTTATSGCCGGGGGDERWYVESVRVSGARQVRGGGGGEGGAGGVDDGRARRSSRASWWPTRCHTLYALETTFANVEPTTIATEAGQPPELAAGRRRVVRVEKRFSEVAALHESWLAPVASLARECTAAAAPAPPFPTPFRGQ